MLLRLDGEAVLVVSQPAHAVVTGRLARAWGNQRAGGFEPREAVCLAADLHDIGWTEWEARPSLRAKTGRPATFMEMPLEPHLEIFQRGVEATRSFGRYATLLVSLHGTGLYQRRMRTEQSESARRQIERFLADQFAIQARLIESLRADPAYRVRTTPEAIERNRRLIAVWDWLSLLLCGGLREPREVPDVPWADGDTGLSLRPVDANPDLIEIDPWPFTAPELTVQVDARRLTGRFTDEHAMQEALDEAGWETITIRLRMAR